jgi:hydrogenase expression/formation protein HypE
MGKLADEDLKKLLTCIKEDKRVVVPPMPGYDAGVHLLGDKYVVVATDPCIGVPDEWFGWLLLNYAASDVALFGAKPEFCTVNLLGPSSTKPEKFRTVMKQVCKAADELNIAIVRGHTGTYNGITCLLGVCTAYGTVQKEKLITPGNAREGDLILCTKSIGLETLVNFALTNQVLAQRILGKVKAKKLTSMVKMESCVHEAEKLSEIRGVHAMHDATEGGFIMALNEVAEASGLGFEIEFERLPINREIKLIQEHFRLTDEQVLATSSTGMIIAAVNPEAKAQVEEAMCRVGFPIAYLGTFTNNKKRKLLRNGVPEPFPRAADDPYVYILSARE